MTTHFSSCSPAPWSVDDVQDVPSPSWPCAVPPWTYTCHPASSSWLLDGGPTPQSPVFGLAGLEVQKVGSHFKS
ncbi:hypothetical protein JTE90_013043 [Oedothorax gibbosus]|uniref:Uncharacterized protein n=1 Tax=Oedothorax gibbosus TaxID=931172 RepID=A0AAV6THZ1_9ARAC|nr:hypothetical protein JTE90_014381 [Oedothorax gibbosus]KAG8183352.1 hypothetical protein JTE90_013043 [Oedothorax gibbosus]